MLIADSIQKRYPTRGDDLVILRDISLKLSPGQSIAVMGPSGCGKSTLLNIFGTLDRPSDGRLTIDESDPFSLSEPDLARFRNRRIGFVFQDHHLMPQCSALENVLLPTLVSEDAADDGLGRARELLDAVGLVERVEHMPAELSGGERQRVAVARALINRPALVLADEPTGNLDRTTGENVGELLGGLPGREDVILIVVTHSERLARRFDRVFDLADGILTSR